MKKGLTICMVMIVLLLALGSSAYATTYYSYLKNSSPKPDGYTTGMFHKIITPIVSRTSGTFTGAAADKLKLPNYNALSARKFGEAGYMYTGIDLFNSKNTSIGGLEIGFGTGLHGNGWVPVFHVKTSQPYSVIYGQDRTNSKKDNYLIDTNRQFASGSVINGYKVYFKKEDSTLDVRFLIGGTLVYEVKIYGVSNVSIKRVTALACPKTVSEYQKLHVIYNTSKESEAVWYNYKILKNNGTSAAFFGNITGAKEYTWLHGGKITYVKDVISSTSRVEKYKFY